MNILSRILAYFAIDNKMKLFFLTLFFFINQKNYIVVTTNKFVQICIYICNFSSFSLSRYHPSIFFLVFLSISNYLQFQESDYVYVYGYEVIHFKSKNLYQLLFFFLVSHLLLVLLLSVTSLLLLYHIFLYN